MDHCPLCRKNDLFVAYEAELCLDRQYLCTTCFTDVMNGNIGGSEGVKRWLELMQLHIIEMQAVLKVHYLIEERLQDAIARLKELSR